MTRYVQSARRFLKNLARETDRFQDCMRQDEALFKIAERVKNFAVIYLCDIDQVRPSLIDPSKRIVL